MDSQSIQDWIMAGNSAAMDWYAITHDKPLPSQSLAERLLGVDMGPISPGVGVSIGRTGITGGHVLVIGAVALGLFFLLRR